MMMEYLVKETSYSDRLDSDKLDQLGLERWKLVGFSVGVDHCHYYIFTRGLKG